MRRSSKAGAAARLLRLAVLVAAALALATACGVPGVLRNGWRVVGLLREEAPTVLPVPVDGVRASRLWSSFGDRRSGGRWHEGIDITAPRGTPVRSTTHGVVTQVGTNHLGGRVVFVMGPAGQRHYYAHLESWGAERAGDWVEAGDVLGTVGDSGNAKGGPTHLHYGIYADGGAIDPFPLLRASAPASEPTPAPAAGSTRRRR